MLPISAGVEPATSWSPVGRRFQLSHRGRPLFKLKQGQDQQELHVINNQDNPSYIM